MKKSLLMGMLLCLTMVLNAQQKMEWYSYWGSDVAGSQIDPVKMVMDNDGNLYIAALFGGEDVMVGSQKLVSNSTADKGDAVIIKLSPENQVLWTYQIAALGKASIGNIAISPAGNLLVTGTFNKAINWISGKQMSKMSLDKENDSSWGGYVLKLSPDGNAIRCWQIPADNISITGLTVDRDLNVIVAGVIDGEARFSDDGEFEGSFKSTSQLFVAKYDNLGKLLWHQFKQDGTAAAYMEPYLTNDESGNLFIGFSLSGTTRLSDITLTATKNVQNGVIAKMDATGEYHWAHVINGSCTDQIKDIALSPAGDVAIAYTHKSDDMKIDGQGSKINNGFTGDAIGSYDHAAVFCFTQKNGAYRWFYDWGWGSCSQDDGKNAGAWAHTLHASKEGVWYFGGEMNGRFMDSDNQYYFNKSRNSGVVTVDGQWMQHNVNGGADAFLCTLTREGHLANVIRPGGIQYERMYDMAMSPDLNSMYILMQIQVRDQPPYTCPDNLFDSYADIQTYGRQSKYTQLTVFCPEKGAAEYTTAYKDQFASTMVVKYAMPKLTPAELPFFTPSVAYSQTLAIENPVGVRSYIYGAGSSSDVTFDGQTISGTFADTIARFVGALAIDSIALPGEISYYEYDSQTKRGVRSNPRTLRYMDLLKQAKPVAEPVVDTDPGRDPEDESDIEQVKAGMQGNNVHKVLVEGQLYILHNKQVYNAQGVSL